MMPDRFDRKLAQILEVSEPESELRPGWEARVKSAISAAGLVGKEKNPMRRFAYAVAFLLVMGLAAAGVFTRFRQPDPRALLISAAEAMESAQTVHVWGKANIGGGPGGPDWGRLDAGHYEQWISPDGARTDRYDAEGRLTESMVMSTASGSLWIYTLPDARVPVLANGLVMEYPIGQAAMQKVIARQNEEFTRSQRSLMKEAAQEEGTEVTLRREQHDGKAVIVVVIDYPDGRSNEFSFNQTTEHLLSHLGYGPESAGKPLVSQFQVEYGMSIPEQKFDFVPPARALRLTDDFEVFDDGGWRLQGPYSFSSTWRLQPSAAWRASASSGGDARAAVDEDPETSWQGAQSAGAWFQVSFGTPVSVSKMMVLHGPSLHEGGRGWPRGAKISYTRDGVAWQDVYTGPASEELPLYGHFDGAKTVTAIRITLTDPADEPWRISEIGFYGPPKK